MEIINKHGGRRSGAGRPANDRSIMVGVRITKEAADILNAQKNKSEFTTSQNRARQSSTS